jgi:hypothetical protein
MSESISKPSGTLKYVKEYIQELIDEYGEDAHLSFDIGMSSHYEHSEYVICLIDPGEKKV